jgi:hypothetical protein
VAVTGGGTFNGAPIPAVATVTGVSGSAASSLEGVSPTLTYFTASGTQLTGAPTSAGNYTVTASFAGSTDYTVATASSPFTIAQVTPTMTATDNGTYNGSAHPGTALLSGVSGPAGSSLDGVSPNFTYYTGTSATGTPLSGALISAGTYTVVATFPGSTNYTSQSASSTFTIAQAVPSVTWATPSAITFGTTLSATQLDASASVSGTFTYTPVSGAVLGVGTHTLSVLFTPADTTDYTTATQTVQLVVNQATPTITWTTPSAITFGTALSGTQLDAGANVAGTFTYTPAAGTVLAVGMQTLSATFTPSDATDYNTVTKTVQLVVSQATPTVTWATPSAITYGTALSATQLNAGADVSGTFVYSPAPGTVLTAGTQTLSVTFIPNDPIDYNTVTKTVQLVVGKATPVVIWNTPAAIPYGTPLSSSQLDAHASVLGTFVYSPAAGTILGTGMQTLSVTFTPSDTANYTTATQTTQLLVNSANPISGTSVFVLSPSAAGALSLSGNAQLNLATGPVYVNSSSSSAISLSGSAQVTAGSISTVGGTQKSANAKFSTSPVTGVGTFGDPLSNLAVPEAATYNLLVKGSVNVSSSASRTINPGIYSQISVSGSGKLTMNPGIYVIAGGGFSVTGNGSVSGDGVMIYNAGSNYLSPSGHTFGVVNLSGNGNISLTAPTSGPYAGILIFQSSDNTNTVALSGNGITKPGGTIYAPAATLTMSGSGKFNGSLVVNTLSLSANAIAQLTAADGVTAVYSPVQVRTAYGVNNLALDGTGQTIAIADAYNNPDISQALDAFDAQFALTSDGSTLDQLYGPASSFLTVVNQRGETGSPPAIDPAGAGTNNWEMETALDVEWAHAISPGAQIVLVEADSQSLSDLMTAVKTAAGLPGVSVVSMSWGFVEGLDVLAQDEAVYDSYLTTPAGHTGVTFVASTGDYGAAVPLYPAMSPNVVAVGGTTLTLNADNSYGNEVGWGAYSNALGLFLGSGGGLSQFEAEPAFQQGVQSTGSRTAPDVSLLADPATGAWIADPYNFGADSPWEMVGGTSLSAPAWGGLLALIDQGRVAAGKVTLGTAGPTEAQTALYGLNAADFHDITSGSNGYSAGPGYDLVSGLGSPVADRLVSDLVAYSGGPPSSTPVAPIAASGLVLNSEVGSVSATVAALTRAAALRVFSAQVIGVPGPVSAAAFGEAIPGTAATGQVVGSSQSTSGAPTGSAFLYDISSAIIPVSAQMTAALSPEMPAHSVANLANRNYALTEPKTLDTFMAGGWVVPDDRTRSDALSAPGFGDADDYFIQMSQDNDEADTGTDAP